MSTFAGKYQLGALLGSGGMAEVWSATNAFTDKQVAIKFLRRSELERTPEAGARFLKEAKASARINHPNVIDILDVGQTEDGQLFLVMELLRGVSLETALKERGTVPLSLHDVVAILTDVASALAAAHRAGVVHRDLKPSNVFLHEAGGALVPKVLDFGVGKFLEEDPKLGLTMAGTVLGSPLYMSPEQARGEADLDGRTDIFAFGAILFEAACGFRAFEAKNFNALIVKIATTAPKDIDLCAPQLPESFRRVVRGCLERERERRFSAFDEIVPLLRACLPDLAQFALPLPPPEDGTSEPPPRASFASAPGGSAPPHPAAAPVPARASLPPVAPPPPRASLPPAAAANATYPPGASVPPPPAAFSPAAPPTRPSVAPPAPSHPRSSPVGFAPPGGLAPEPPRPGFGPGYDSRPFASFAAPSEGLLARMSPPMWIATAAVLVAIGFVVASIVSASSGPVPQPAPSATPRASARPTPSAPASTASATSTPTDAGLPPTMSVEALPPAKGL